MTIQTILDPSIKKKTLVERIKEYRNAEGKVTEETVRKYSEKPIKEKIKVPKPKATKIRKAKEPMSMEIYQTRFSIDNLKKIDTWATDKYLEYYSKILPAIKPFMNQPEGYKPIAIANNIPFWIETNQTSRKCGSSCKLSEELHKRYMLPAGENKTSIFWCELDPVYKGMSAFNRQKIFSSNVLWSIDDLINRPNLIRTMRSLYYHSAIRYYENKDKWWTNKWDEISSLNAVVDIDITHKHTTDIYEKEDKLGCSRYDLSFEMLSKIADALTEIGIVFKIRSSGNGWYFEFDKVIIKEHNVPEYENLYSDKDQTKTVKHKDGTIDTYVIKKEIVFYNRIINRIQYVKDYIIRPIIEEKYSKYFELDGGEPDPGKLYKSPYSLHQRLDYVAKPTNLDELNSNNTKEFKELCSPNRILNDEVDYWKEWK